MCNQLLFWFISCQNKFTKLSIFNGAYLYLNELIKFHDNVVAFAIDHLFVTFLKLANLIN